jgi:hypothetical protein
MVGIHHVQNAMLCLSHHGTSRASLILIFIHCYFVIYNLHTLADGAHRSISHNTGLVEAPKAVFSYQSHSDEDVSGEELSKQQTPSHVTTGRAIVDSLIQIEDDVEGGGSSSKRQRNQHKKSRRRMSKVDATSSPSSAAVQGEGDDKPLQRKRFVHFHWLNFVNNYFVIRNKFFENW